MFNDIWIPTTAVVPKLNANVEATVKKVQQDIGWIGSYGYKIEYERQDDGSYLFRVMFTGKIVGNTFGTKGYLHGLVIATMLGKFHTFLDRGHSLAWIGNEMNLSVANATFIEDLFGKRIKFNYDWTKRRFV